MKRAFGILLGAALLAGCPSVEDPDADGGVRDGGDPNDPCRGYVPDDGGGIVIACNATDGTRCDVSRNLTCVWNLADDDGVCQCLSNPQPLGAECGGRSGPCAAGMTCLGLAGDTRSRCYKVCDVPDNMGCEAVAADDPSTAYTCAPLRRTDDRLTENYGICFGVGVACDPFDDQCPSDQACGLIGRAPACRPVGARGFGETCSTDDPCVRGAMCVPLVDAMGTPLGTRCYAPCRLEDGICTSGACADVGLSVGLCV